MISKFIEWNEEQREHEQIFQKLCLDFGYSILKDALKHDNSKWGQYEYENIVNER